MTSPTTIYVSTIRLAAVLTAVGLSREFIRQTLRFWQLADHVDAAELIVSELVTNAVKETGITDPSPRWETVKAHHLIGVQLRVVNGSLYVEVWDRGDGSPAITEQSDDAEGGRGLFLVQSVSKKWGVHRPAVGGKVVWSELALTESAHPPLLKQGLPPRCPGSHGPTVDAELQLVDMALMQRVREGLRLSLRGKSDAVAV